MTTADSHDMQAEGFDESGDSKRQDDGGGMIAAPGAVCHPNESITARYNTERHKNWENAQERCEREGVNAEVCATG